VVDRSAAGKSPYRFELHLLNDPETINAFALPGGQVFITEGLLKRLSTDGELAGVLGHETGHVVGRHGAEHIAKEQLTQGLTGAAVRPEIMIPLVIAKAEFDFIKARIDAIAQAVAAETCEIMAYSVGTMIETPRASLRAGELAETAEFFSFGTNDLTQTCLALSRDDAGSFLGDYTAKGILPASPFATIDQEGVGELIEIAAARGRKTRPAIKLGICGEHAGDPASIDFFERAGLTYVSCSPFRVPVARLAAAQAALRRKATSEA